MKARLPLLSTSAVERTPSPRLADAQRVAVGRAMIGVSDYKAPELALRFASRLLATLHARDRHTAALLAASTGRTREGDARRLREAGAERVIIVAADELPSAAVRELGTLAQDCIVVALGMEFVAQLSMLLSVRVSLAPTAALRDATGIDVELGPGMEGSATLIGDWLARRVDGVSSRGFAQPT